MRYLFLITLVLSLVSKANSVKTDLAIKQSGVLQLSTFAESEIPKEINGCSAYFYRTMNDRKSEKYIGVNDLGRYAFIKINNKLIKFIQTKYSDMGKKYSWSYQSQDKNIILTIAVQTSKEVGNESSFITGAMTIETKDGKKTVIPFVGDSGC